MSPVVRIPDGVFFFLLFFICCAPAIAAKCLRRKQPPLRIDFWSIQPRPWNTTSTNPSSTAMGRLGTKLKGHLSSVPGSGGARFGPRKRPPPPPDSSSTAAPLLSTETPDVEEEEDTHRDKRARRDSDSDDFDDFDAGGLGGNYDEDDGGEFDVNDLLDDDDDIDEPADAEEFVNYLDKTVVQEEEEPTTNVDEEEQDFTSSDTTPNPLQIITESPFGEDTSVSLPHTRLRSRISDIEFAYGLWCEGAGISRAQYISLCEINNHLDPMQP